MEYLKNVDNYMIVAWLLHYMHQAAESAHDRNSTDTSSTNISHVRVVGMVDFIVQLVILL